MKKLIFIVLILALTIICSAAYDISVLIDGYPVEFDVPPQIINDRTMVPVRKTFEMLGAEVEWVDELKLVLATYKTFIIAMPIGEYSFNITNVVTGETNTVQLDVPPQIVDSRTLVPLRAISEALGKKVDYAEKTRTVYITD